MKLAMCLWGEVDEKWPLAKQMGVDHAVTLSDPKPDHPLADYQTMALLKKRYEDAGLDLQVVEGWIPMENIRRATPEREREMELVQRTVENMGALEIPVLCYNWMAYFNWLRTSVTTRLRGGALTSSYDHSVMSRQPGANKLRITEAELWDNLQWFLERMVPVAERAGVKLAMHPDDPPLSPIAGVPRIMSSVEGFERLLSMSGSESNGITFCQANFSLMTGPENVPATIRRFGPRIHFVHFRDVRGTAERFEETFHDDGPTDMFAVMRAYREVGFRGAIRPDHAPAMEGDPNLRPGYETRGRLFAIGYMRGLLEGVDAVEAGAAGRA